MMPERGSVVNVTAPAWDAIRGPRPGQRTRTLGPAPRSVIAPRLIALADGLLEPLPYRKLAPLQALRRVAGDAVQERAQRLRGTERHVLVRLVDEQFGYGKMVCSRPRQLST